MSKNYIKTELEINPYFYADNYIMIDIAQKHLKTLKFFD